MRRRFSLGLLHTIPPSQIQNTTGITIQQTKAQRIRIDQIEYAMPCSQANDGGGCLRREPLPELSFSASSSQSQADSVISAALMPLNSTCC